MPLPLIPALLGGAAIIGALTGAKKGYDGYKDGKEAARLHEKAKDLYTSVSRELESSKTAAQSKFEELGIVKSKVVETTLEKYAKLIDKANIESNSNKLVIESHTLAHFQEVRASIVEVGSAIGGLAAGAGAGALAGFGAFGAAGALASASTGTAIASLSGVAATNATLAFFGGGSLAAGGLGVAGGTAVLGGVVAAPVILVAGLIFAKSAEKRKYDAQAYYDSIRAVAESMRSEANLWEHTQNRAIEAMQAIMQLDSQLKNLMQEVRGIIKKNSGFFAKLFGFWDRKGARGYEVSRWSKEEQLRLQATMQTAETLVNTINAPILSDADPVTRDIMSLQRECQELMDDINRRWGQS